MNSLPLRPGVISANAKILRAMGATHHIHPPANACTKDTRARARVRNIVGSLASASEDQAASVSRPACSQINVEVFRAFPGPFIRVSGNQKATVRCVYREATDLQSVLCCLRRVN